MHKFESIILESLKNIEKEYFVQQTVVLDKFKYNERIFCYEFYHQLRLKQQNFEGISISGEAVKSNYQFSNLKNNNIPDILIHNFGTIDNNEVIIEVKTIKNKQSLFSETGMKKDFNILNTFTCDPINYKLGIYILINFDFFKLIDENTRVGNHIKKVLRNNKKIIIWNIPEPEFIHGKIDENSILIYNAEAIEKKINP